MSEYFELPRQPAGEFDAAAVVNACIESGTDRLLLDDRALPPEFFDLSTRIAGTMVQRLTQYEIRMAAVVPDPSIHPLSAVPGLCPRGEHGPVVVSVLPRSRTGPGMADGCVILSE